MNSASLQDGSTVEFGQLSKDDLPAVSAYVSQQRLRVGTGEDEESEGDDDGAGQRSVAEGGASEGDADDSEGSDEVRIEWLWW